MEGAYKLPPLDLDLLQQKLPGGRLPPSYCSKDEWGCSRVIACKVCPAFLSSVEELEEHVVGLEHWRRLGKLFVSGQLRETFPPEQEGREQELEECCSCKEEDRKEVALGECTECKELLCSSCCSAHAKTRLTKDHHVKSLAGPRHPREDEEEGVAVPRNRVSYLLAVYSSLPEEEQEAVAFAPPPAPEMDYASLYTSGGGSTVRMGWGEGEGAPPGHGAEFSANPLGNPFAPRGGGSFSHPGYRPMGLMGPGEFYPSQRGGRGRGRGRGGRRPAPVDPGEVLLPAEDEGGNTAYTGALGRRGTIEQESKKLAPKFAALPPPGHTQWNNIEGQENGTPVRGSSSNMDILLKCVLLHQGVEWGLGLIYRQTRGVRRYHFSSYYISSTQCHRSARTGGTVCASLGIGAFFDMMALSRLWLPSRL